LPKLNLNVGSFNLKPKLESRKSKLLTMGYKAKNDIIAKQMYVIILFVVGFAKSLFSLPLLKYLKIRNMVMYRVEVIIKFPTQDLEKFSILLGLIIEPINNIIALISKTDI